YENATAGRPSDQLKLKAQVRAPWRRVFVSASQSHSFVAPGDPGLQLAQVVVGAADADGEQGDAQVQELRAEFVRLALDAAGALDLRWVAADVGAVLVEDLHLAADHLRVAEAVPDVGVLGDQAQRLLLAAATDRPRDLARRGRVRLAPAALAP